MRITSIAVLKQECNRILGRIPLISLCELFISTVLRISEFTKYNFDYNTIVLIRFWFEYTIVLIINLTLVLIVSYFNESINYLEIVSKLNLNFDVNEKPLKAVKIESLVYESMKQCQNCIPNASGFIPIKRSMIVSFFGAVVSFSAVFIQLL